mmetsp:Transcript_21864/g.39880  ORF Transcript_21864/g.39880 Transcript_21864/m.39880 type:complete len:221 (+) Transcript_21864:1609-2271(+)
MFDRYLKDSVRPTRRFIRFRRLACPPSIADTYHINNVLSPVGLDLCKARDHDAFDLIFPDFKILRSSSDQIPDVLVVYLEVAESHLIVPLKRTHIHCPEELQNRHQHEARTLLISKHRISLASSCCSIREDSGVVAADDTFKEEARGLVKDLLLSRTESKNKVEGVLFLFGTVHSEGFFRHRCVCTGIEQDDDLAVEDFNDLKRVYFSFLLGEGPRPNSY